jgi:hypothetical protein
MSHDPMHLGNEPLQLRSAARCGAKTRSGRPCQAGERYPMWIRRAASGSGSRRVSAALASNRQRNL